MQARVDPTRGETSFVKGRHVYLGRLDKKFTSRLSLESSTYQGIMYRVRLSTRIALQLQRAAQAVPDLWITSI